jgi:VWFA-related protein
MTRLSLLLGLALLPAAVLTQETGSAPANPAGNLRLDVVAIDSKGVPVTDLKPSEFEVWISGYRVPIADVYAITPETTGRTMVLVLDNGAIGPELAFRVKDAARLFVKKMGANDRIAVVPLNGGTLELTDDRQRLLQAIDSYHVQGFPFRLDDAGEHVLRIIDTFARRLPETVRGRKTIVGLGAGWLFDTPLPPPSVRNLEAEWVATMRTMAGTNTSLYVIDPAGLGMVRGAGAYGGASGFARETGGYAFMNTNDVAGAVERIWAESGTYYVLAVGNPPVQRTADLREVDIKVRRSGVTVRARRGIKGKP